MRLLVVEDDDIVADAIARGLNAARYAVHRVTSAEAGNPLPTLILTARAIVTIESGGHGVETKVSLRFSTVEIER